MARHMIMPLGESDAWRFHASAFCSLRSHRTTGRINILLGERGTWRFHRVTDRVVRTMMPASNCMRGAFLTVVSGLMLMASPVPASTITGSVTDKDARPIAGAAVSVSQTNGTYTDAEGRFDLKNIVEGTYTISVSAVGFVSQQRSVEVDGRRLNVDFILDEDVRQLETVTVEGQSEAREMATRALTISTVDLKGTFEKKLSIGDVLTTVPGVRVRSSGGVGSEADVSVNGMRGNAVRMYVDGIPLEFIAAGLNISQVPLNSVKRIDIYKGVMPVEVGTDALGGGINIISNQPTRNYARFSYRIGSFNTHQAGAVLGLVNKNKDVYFNLNASFDHADNDYKMEVTDIISGRKIDAKRFNDAFESFYTRASFGILNKKFADEFRIAASYASFYKEYQNGLIVNTIPFGEARYKADNYTLQLDYQKELFKNFSFETKISYGELNYVFTDTTRNIYSWTGEVYRRHEFGGEVSGHREPAFPHITTRGIVNRTTLQYSLPKAGQITLSNFIARQDQEGHNPLIDEAAGDIDFLKRPHNMLKNITGLQYSITLLDEKLTLGAAGKYYYYEINGIEPLSKTPMVSSGERFGWNTSVKYAFLENWFARASFEQATRIPDFNEVFGNNTTIVPNVALKPEESNNANAGIFYEQKFAGGKYLSAETNGFFRRQHNRIFLNANGGVAALYENRQSVDVTGVEFAVRASPVKDLSAVLNVTYQSVVLVESGLPNQQFLNGTRLANEPVFFYNAELRYTFKDLFRTATPGLYLFFNHIDEFAYIPTGKQYNPDNFVPVQNQLDIGASCKFFRDRFTASVNVQNVLNAGLYDYYKVPKPGTNFNVQLIYEINQF